MIRRILQSTLCLCLTPLLVARQAISYDPGPNTPAKAATITLRKGTVVALALINPLSSATAQKGQTVRLALAEDVIVNGVVVIRRGAPASGVIKSVRKALPRKHDGSLQIEPASLTLPDNPPIALGGYTPTGGDGVCEGFGNCLGLIVVATPFAIVVGVPVLLVSLAKAPFQRHHNPVSGIDETQAACTKLWGATTTKSVVNNPLPDPFQPSQSAVDFDAICPPRTTPAPSSDAAFPPEHISQHALVTSLSIRQLRRGELYSVIL